MLRGFVLGVILTIVGIAAAVYALLATGSVPANADGPNLPFERYFARMSLHATLRDEAPKGPNPVALNDADLTEGVRLYAPRCALCHGVADKKPTAISRGELPRPPILAAHGVEDDPEGVTFWKIKHGIRWTGMPAWGKDLTDQQIWTLALFLKHMDKLSPGAEAAWKAAKIPDQAVATSAPPQNPGAPAPSSGG